MKIPTGQGLRAVPRWAVLALPAFVLTAALAVAAAGATRSAGLDRSYGMGGVVKVSAPFAIGKDAFVVISGFGAARNGAAYAVGSVYPCTPPHCGPRAFLMHFGADGARDRSFGDEGEVPLHGINDSPKVIVDGSARAVIFERDRGKVVLRRFEPDGNPDRAFGADGVVAIPCSCAGDGAKLLKLSGGHLMIAVIRRVPSKKLGYGSVASKVRLLELLPDGRRDKSFGRSGSVAFEIPRRGDIRSVAPTADDGIVFGGIGWETRPRHAWLWRVTASGHADTSFDRNAAYSLGRLGPLGEFADLGSIVPRADGTVEAVGTIHEHLGFVLRLRRNGKLATGFGVRGLTTLPSNLEAAVGGTDGAVFAVGEGKHSYYYSAYRVLAGGALDPAYRGRRGIKVPLPGEGIGVQSQGAGRALVTNIGYYECRQDCPSEPGMARFLE